MGLIGTVVAGIAAILVAVLARLVADETKAWAPRIVSGLIQRAAAALPKEHRARLSEEWQSHAEQLPGDIAKILACIGFWIASRRILAEARSDYVGKLIFDIAVSLALLLLNLPVILLTALLIRIDSPGPVFSRQ